VCLLMGPTLIHGNGTARHGHIAIASLSTCYIIDEVATSSTNSSSITAHAHTHTLIVL
jgi:hypothetical protein